MTPNPPRRPIRRLATRLALLAGVATLAACGTTPAQLASSVYLHSPSEEAAVTSLTEGLKSAKTAHLAAIDKHKTYLTEALAAERKAAVEREIALRDDELSAIMVTAPKGAAAGADLGPSIDRRLTSLGILPARADALATQRVDFGADELARIRLDLSEDRATRERMIRAFEIDDGKGVYCDQNGEGALSRSMDGRNPDAFTMIVSSCRAIRTSLGLIKPWIPPADTADPEVAARNAITRALLTDEPATPALPPGELAEALRTRQSLADAEKVQAALSRELAQKLKDLKTFYECEQKRAATPTRVAQLSAMASEIKGFAAWLASPETAPPPEPAATPQAEESKLACGTAPRLPRSTSDLAEGAIKRNPGDTNLAKLLTPENVKAAIATLQKVGVARGLSAGLQAEAKSFESGTLHEVLGAIADPAAQADGRDAQIAAALTRMLGRVERINEALSGRLPDTSAVLVDLAAAELGLANAKLELNRLHQASRLADLRVRARRAEAFALIRARRAVKADPAGMKGLRAYADAWNAGAIPLAAIEADERTGRYATWVARERATTEATYAVLEPATTELATYAKGGITAEDIARYLQTTGIIAIAEK